MNLLENIHAYVQTYRNAPARKECCIFSANVKGIVCKMLEWVEWPEIGGWFWNQVVFGQTPS